jgi:hypothetical protein
MRSQRVTIGAPADSPAAMHSAGLMPPALLTNLSYMAVLEQQGVERDPATGTLVHWLPYGTRERGGRAVPVMKRFPVALTAEEARVQTRATGDRWDFYAVGLKCRDCANPLTGWVLGGRKLQAEHDHVTEATPELYREYDDEGDAMGAESPDPVAVGA